MTITGANATIRGDLDEAAGARALRLLARYEQRALEALEVELEQLHLKGYKRIPATFVFPAGVSSHTRRVITRGMSIRRAIECIFDDLMEQPLPGWNRRIAKSGFYPSPHRFSTRLGIRYHS